jgi:predicted Na+-dependent transporter
MTDLLGGESTKALVATTLAHLISPIVTPFLVWLTTRTIIDVSFLDLLLLICKLVLIPFILAQIVRQFKQHEVFARQSQPINTCLLFFLNWGIVAPASSLVIASPGIILWLAVVVAITLVGAILIDIWFGRTRKEDITWSVVNSYKNTGLASVIVLSILPPIALFGTIAYAIVTSLAIIILQVIFKK